MHPGRECRRHRATRGAAANAAVACRCRRTVDSVTANITYSFTVSSLNVISLSALQLLIRSWICLSWTIVAAISLLGTHGPAAVRGVRCRARRAATTRRGVPPRRGIVANRVRRAAATAVKSVRVPPCGDTDDSAADASR